MRCARRSPVDVDLDPGPPRRLVSWAEPLVDREETYVPAAVVWTPPPPIVRVGSEEPAGPEDVSVRCGTALGNPFQLRGDGDREAACAAYSALLRTAEPCHRIAKRHGGPCGLVVHEPSARMKPHVRLEALKRLAHRAQSGGIRVRCTCRSDERCHGDVIVAWVMQRLAAA